MTFKEKMQTFADPQDDSSYGKSILGAPPKRVNRKQKQIVKSPLDELSSRVNLLSNQFQEFLSLSLKENGSRRKCYLCGQRNHMAAECTNIARRSHVAYIDTGSSHHVTTPVTNSASTTETPVADNSESVTSNAEVTPSAQPVPQVNENESVSSESTQQWVPKSN